MPVLKYNFNLIFDGDVLNSIFGRLLSLLCLRRCILIASTIGIGAGQPSRLDSCKLAIQKAKQFRPNKIRNSVAASDAFFPFADGVEALVKAGVRTIIQPGGSIRDQEIINLANKAKVKMFFTDIRHFNH